MCRELSEYIWFYGSVKHRKWINVQYWMSDLTVPTTTTTRTLPILGRTLHRGPTKILPKNHDPGVKITFSNYVSDWLLTVTENVPLLHFLSQYHPELILLLKMLVLRACCLLISNSERYHCIAMFRAHCSWVRCGLLLFADVKLLLWH